MLLFTLFREYLAGRGLSPSTIRNYLSDFNHFWNWLSLETRKTRPVQAPSTANLSGLLTPKISQKYHFYLVSRGTPPATIRRRFSSLRCWADFARTAGWLGDNPFVYINHTRLPHHKQEISTADILRKYKIALQKEAVAASSIRNYLSDIRHFLHFVQTQT